jgi:hypothetical protein
MIDMTRIWTAVAMIVLSESGTFPIRWISLALLDAVEEHLRRLTGGHGTAEQCVVIEQSYHVCLAV